MGIEIQEAREKLDILERLADEPQLIFTDLFSDDKNDYSFFMRSVSMEHGFWTIFQSICRSSLPLKIQ